MPIDRYDHYGQPRLHVTDKGVFLIRDVLDVDGEFSGICEYGRYFGDDILWTQCKEGVEFDQIAAFLPSDAAEVALSPPEKEG